MINLTVDLHVFCQSSSRDHQHHMPSHTGWENTVDAQKWESSLGELQKPVCWCDLRLYVYLKLMVRSHKGGWGPCMILDDWNNWGLLYPFQPKLSISVLHLMHVMVSLLIMRGCSPTPDAHLFFTSRVCQSHLSLTSVITINECTCVSLHTCPIYFTVWGVPMCSYVCIQHMLLCTYLHAGAFIMVFLSNGHFNNGRQGLAKMTLSSGTSNR